MSMSIDALRNNLTNPARVYMWDVVIPNLPGGGNEDTIEIRGFSSAIPGRAVGEILLPFKGTAGMKVPGKLDLTHTWAVTFRESTDKKTFEALHAWQEAIIGVKTGIGGPDPMVKADLYLRCLDLNGSPWLKIKLVGCYVQGIDEVPLSYDADGVIMYTCTFSYDYWHEA